jgi:hypothetical protein
VAALKLSVGPSRQSAQPRNDDRNQFPANWKSRTEVETLLAAHDLDDHAVAAEALAAGAATMCGVAVETDHSTGLALRTAAVRMGPHLEVQQPT